jgi:hypothetical protein
MEVDERLKKELGASRRSRAMDDRSVTERREVSEDDRLRMFQNQLFNDALPDLPEIPGYHVCWLATTNPRDSIHRRMQLPFFANARSIRNAIDRARMRQANRLYNRSGATVSRLELMTIEADDITASRVFQGEVEGLDPSTPLTAG